MELTDKNNDNIDIGSNLKKERNQLGLTLNDVSKRTGVSSTMLGQIERGQSSPTISTIWKISTGLKIPIAKLLVSNKSESYEVKHFNDLKKVKENSKTEIYNLIPFNPLSALDGLYAIIQANTIYESTGHDNALYEFVFVISGQLTICIDEATHYLKDLDSISFNGGAKHIYKNESSQPVVFLSIVKY